MTATRETSNALRTGWLDSTPSDLSVAEAAPANVDAEKVAEPGDQVILRFTFFRKSIFPGWRERCERDGEPLASQDSS